MSNELELLEKIVINTSSSMNPLWVAGITGATAILTVLITSVIAYKINKNTLNLEREKIKAEIITKERMLWLKQLRENASDFFAEMDFYYALLKRELTVSADLYQKELDVLARSIMKKSNILMYCLITKDVAQLELYNSINDTQKFIIKYNKEKPENTSSRFDDEYQTLKQKFASAVEDIGTETWKQIKSFE